MAKITRKHQKILGSNSANNGQLGSARDGAFVLSDDPDVLQGLSAWDDGLLVATLTGERLPTVEEIQGVYYVLTRQVAYIMQEGIAEYSADATYYQNSIVKEAGTVKLYRSLTDDNIGNPLSDGAEWEFIIDLSAPNPQNNFSASADPTVNDDEGEGYSAGSIWRNGDALFICVDATEGAAVWVATNNVPDGSITNAKLADIPANTLLMNPTGSSATPQAVDPYAAMPIGMPFPVLEHLVGVDAPYNGGDAKFVRLSASHPYNAGLLTSESVTGSAPLVVATAVIDYASSPMDGQTIHLLNTENRYLMPHNTSGGVANDQMQVITGSTNGQAWLAGTPGAGFSGALSGSAGEATRPAAGSSAATTIVFNSANSPNARTGNHTNVKHQRATYYMRIA